jgi:fluoride exporter
VIVLAVAGAGALGAPCRYLLEAAISRRTGHRFPWGTTVVNLLGALLLGLLAGRREFHGLNTDVATIAGVGFLGAFTTFSTFAVETTRLAPRARALYVTVSVVGGVGLAATGLALASL